MKASLCLILTLVLTSWATAQEPSPAEKLGWKLAIHSYTFQKFSIFDAIDKTAAMGVKNMSISGSVNLLEDGKIKKASTVTISDKDAEAIKARMIEKKVDPTFVNMGVVKPGIDEAESRKIFEGAKRLGISVLVAEPESTTSRWPSTTIRAPRISIGIRTPCWPPSRIAAPFWAPAPMWVTGCAPGLIRSSASRSWKAG